MSDDTLNIHDRIGVAHRSLLPVRTSSDVVEMSGRVTLSRVVAAPVRMTVAETLFDYQPGQWFGVAMNQPTPPPWTSANEASRNALKSLGKQLLGQSDTPASLRAAVEKVLAQLN